MKASNVSNLTSFSIDVPCAHVQATSREMLPACFRACRDASAAPNPGRRVARPDREIDGCDVWICESPQRSHICWYGARNSFSFALVGSES